MMFVSLLLNNRTSRRQRSLALMLTNRKLPDRYASFACTYLSSRSGRSGW